MRKLTKAEAAALEKKGVPVRSARKKSVHKPPSDASILANAATEASRMAAAVTKAALEKAAQSNLQLTDVIAQLRDMKPSSEPAAFTITVTSRDRSGAIKTLDITPK